MAITYEQKKQNVKTMTRIVSACTGVLCAYIFGYAGYISGRDGEGFINALVTVSKRLSDFKLFYRPSGDLLPYMFAGLLVGIVVYFFLSNDNARNDSYMMQEIAGTGGFMNKKEQKEYASKFIYSDPPAITKYPVKKGEWQELQDMYSQNMIMSMNFSRPINSREIIGNNNVLVVGGAGTGKSRFVIKPNMLQMNASYIITDPSGEMIYSLGKVLRNNGYKIKIFNISDMQHSNCYNPIKYIRNEAGVNMVIQCLIDNTTKGERGGENQFFVDAEKLLYSACLFYLIDYCDDESMKNFSGVMELINSSSVNEKDPNAKSPLDQLFDKLPKPSLARKYYTAFKQAAGKTLKSIIISCVTRLQPFMTPQVANLTKADELHLEALGDERTALFIITPQADRTYSFLASMLYSQLFETLYHVGEQQKANGQSEQLKVPVRCLMDEFANIGEVPEFPSRLATMRKYNISATIVLQDISQIEAMYKDEWKTLVANCSTKIFLGSPEPDTLEWFSGQLGKMTVRSKSSSFSDGGKGGGNKSFQYTSREVMTPDELGRLPKNESIILTQNMRPVRDFKYKYETHPYYPQTADADKENGFEYNKLAAFNNSRMGNYMSMFAAANEAARVKKKDASKKDAGGNNRADNRKPDKTHEEKEKLRNKAVTECQTRVFDVFDNPVCAVEMFPVDTDILRHAVKTTGEALKVNRIIAFIPANFEDLGFSGYYGYGIDKSKSDELLLSDAIEEMKKRGLAAKTAKKNHPWGMECMVAIKKENFETFGKEINGLYIKEGEEEDESKQ